MKFYAFIPFSLLVCIILTGGKCTVEDSSNKSKSCFDRAHFMDPEYSDYILPFPAGKRYILSQSYCYQNGGHRNQLAYDFALPIGSQVIASRTGIVIEVSEDLQDTGASPNPGDHNHVFIKHNDSTIAFYAHIQQNGSLVKSGDSVKQGQNIAKSGNSGNTMNFPHLHFGVYESWPPQEGFDLPISFKNVKGPLDSLGGLIADQWYEALHF